MFISNHQRFLQVFCEKEIPQTCRYETHLFHFVGKNDLGARNCIPCALYMMGGSGGERIKWGRV